MCGFDGLKTLRGGDTDRALCCILLIFLPVFTLRPLHSFRITFCVSKYEDFVLKSSYQYLIIAFTSLLRISVVTAVENPINFG